ncbi:MAG TPA: MmgE/PrpD family protein [Burkholderiales bacterium]|nr:MmgE/PrpD family protein [Burkholderiales bacterium]
MKPQETPISPLMRTVSAYIAGALKKPLPEGVTEVTKHHLLDTLAAMVSGSHLLPGRKAIAYIKAQGGTKEACVPGSRIVTTVVNAALAGGMLAHADETDDSHAPSLTHPGCGIVPAALAMAEREQAGGTALLRAVALGYDIGTRLSIALGGYEFSEAGHDTHAFGPMFGAAAAAGALAGLTTDQVRHMLSYTAQQASGLSNYARDTEHIEKAFIFGGMPARNGAAAATMVASGMTGIDDSFSGQRNFFFAFGPKARPEELTRGLGEVYEVVNTNIKRWSVGSPIQAPLDSLSELIKVHKLKAPDVEKVVVRVSHRGANTVNNREMPDICMQHMVAVMMLDGTATFEAAHDVKRMQDPKVLEVRRRVELYGDDELQRAMPSRQGIVELKLRDGRELRHHTREVRGTAANPMNREEVDEKCFPLLASVIGKKRARDLIDRVWRIEQVKDVRALRPLLRS